jgi:site-specific recombinase XerD
MIDKFKNYLSIECGFSENTLLAYTRDIKQFLDFIKDKEIDIKIIHEYIKFLKTINLKNSSIKRKIASIRTYIKFLDPKNEWINYIESIKKENNNLNYLNENQINQLIEKCNNKRDALLIKLMAESGLRVSECVSICTEDVNFARQEILIKGKNKMERIVPLTTDCANLLKNHIASLSGESGFIFLNNLGRIISRRSVSNMIQKFAFKCGFKNNTAHSLRRSCATNLLNKNVDIDLISKLLGHRDKNSIQPYLSISLERLKQVYKNCHPRL